MTRAGSRMYRGSAWQSRSDTPYPGYLRRRQSDRFPTVQPSSPKRSPDKALAAAATGTSVRTIHEAKLSYRSHHGQVPDSLTDRKKENR